jgi:hypothetical protein
VQVKQVCNNSSSALNLPNGAKTYDAPMQTYGTSPPADASAAASNPLSNLSQTSKIIIFAVVFLIIILMIASAVYIAKRKSRGKKSDTDDEIDEAENNEVDVVDE